MESPTAGAEKSNLRTGGGVSAKSLVYRYLGGGADWAGAVWASHVKGSARNDQLAAPAWLGAAELRAGAFGLKMLGS